MKVFRKHRGVTLTEILIIIAVIGVLGTGYFIADSVSRRLEEKKYVEEGKIK